MRKLPRPADSWSPLCADRHTSRPTVGSLIAYRHAVWRVARIVFPPLRPAEMRAWVKDGRPDLEKWTRAPYHVYIDYVAGALPEWVKPGDATVQAIVKATIVPGADLDDDPEPLDHPEEAEGEDLLPLPQPDVLFRGMLVWYSYPPDGRWPQCSCCGEPMPCRAAMTDAEVAASMSSMEVLLRRGADDCWGCGEAIRVGQRVAAYPGDNLDLPGGPGVRFHTRRSCYSSAVAYEMRWLTGDVARERVVSWPRCHGTLVVHADGDTECSNGNPDCRGYSTHDHGSQAVCYAATRAGCQRGCVSYNHPGKGAVRYVRRPRLPR